MAGAKEGEASLRKVPRKSSFGPQGRMASSFGYSARATFRLIPSITSCQAKKKDPMNSQKPSESASSPLSVRVTASESHLSPDLENIQSVILRDSARVSKVAKFSAIRDRHTGEVHHHALSIQTYRRRAGEEHYDKEHSVSLTSEGEDEIQKLLNFLQAARGVSSEVREGYLIVNAPQEASEREALESILSTLSGDGKVNVMAEILERSRQDEKFLDVLLERVSRNPQLFAEAAAALNLATYRAAVEQLKALVNTEGKVRESAFQELLTENPWLFGSEYSELLARRRLTRDELQDFVVRRTTDGDIELIEIKTPLDGANLFNYDTSHKSYYAGVELSKVVGQVQNYLEKIDAERNAILANDGEETCKIKAKIIIGRDGDEDQGAALRRFNGHLHRIEVLTFDQLLKIAERVLSYLESALRPIDLESDASDGA